MTKLEIQKILSISFFSDDLERNVTIKEYLKELLLVLWSQQEGFSGKRPFGNSGWSWDLYKALIENGVKCGSLDSDGYVEHVTDDADEIIRYCIRAL